MLSSVKQALRYFILYSADTSSEFDRGNALDEYVKLNTPTPIIPILTHEMIQDWRTIREKQGRISCVKDIRTKLNVGLSEAMVICKGIETHYGIN